MKRKFHHNIFGDILNRVRNTTIYPFSQGMALLFGSCPIFRKIPGRNNGTRVGKEISLFFIYAQFNRIPQGRMDNKRLASASLLRWN